MNKLLFSIAALFVQLLSYGQQTTLFALDYDHTTEVITGVRIFQGDQLLGTTGNTGSCTLPAGTKGTVTLVHPNYGSQQVKISKRASASIELMLKMRQPVYDSIKALQSPELYTSCSDSSTAQYFVNKTTPEFTNAVTAYLETALRYPNRAKDARQQGTVTIQVILGADGNVLCATVYKGVSFELDQEALRVIRNVSPWKPAKRNGVAVPSITYVEVPFRLDLVE